MMSSYYRYQLTQADNETVLDFIHASGTDPLVDFYMSWEATSTWNPRCSSKLIAKQVETFPPWARTSTTNGVICSEPVGVAGCCENCFIVVLPAETFTKSYGGSPADTSRVFAGNGSGDLLANVSIPEATCEWLHMHGSGIDAGYYQIDIKRHAAGLWYLVLQIKMADGSYGYYQWKYEGELPCYGDTDWTFDVSGTASLNAEGITLGGAPSTLTSIAISCSSTTTSTSTSTTTTSTTSTSTTSTTSTTTSGSTTSTTSGSSTTSTTSGSTSSTTGGSSTTTSTTSTTTTTTPACGGPCSFTWGGPGTGWTQTMYCNPASSCSCPSPDYYYSSGHIGEVVTVSCVPPL